MNVSNICTTMAGTVLAAGLVAGATSAPALAAKPAVPSYAHPAPAGETSIAGTIASIPGTYRLQVRDVRGYLDNVALHQGTVINPTGLTLEPGMQVTVYGRPAGSVFAANEIDTPYTAAIVYPYPPSYPYWGPGPLWGPHFRFGLRFG